MATFDAAIDGSKTAAGTTLDLALTVGNHSNRVVYVGISSGGNGVTVASVTYSGTSDSITELYDDIGAPSFSHLALYRILNPQVGTFTIQITFDIATPGAAAARSYYDVSQADPDDTIASGNEEDMTQNTLSVATASGETVVAWVSALDAGTWTALNSQTNGTAELYDSASTQLVSADVVASGATQAMEWSFPGGPASSVRSVGLSLNAAAAAGVAWALPATIVSARSSVRFLPDL